MNIRETYTMKNKMMKCVSAFLLCGLLVASTVTFAAEGKTKDATYYSYTVDDIKNSIPSIVNSWSSFVTITEDETQGVKVQWKSATRNMRVEIPKILSLDGMHAVFSDLQVTGNSKIAFVFTERAMYSDYVTNMNANALARLPFALSLDFVNGKVTAHAGKAYTVVDSEIVEKVVYQSDNLKAENLADKQWSLSFKRVTGETEAQWKITIAGETFTVLEKDMKTLSSQIDFNQCYMAITAWDAGANNISLVINSCHSGANTCADDPANASLLKTAADTMASINQIDEITYESGKKIVELYDLYSNMPVAMQSLITNSDELMEAYSIYQIVKQIHELGTITLDSQNKLNEVYEAYNALSDEQKLRVSNLDTFMNAKAKYLKLQLGEYVTASDKTKDEVNYIYEDRIINNVGEDVEQIVDVDGGMETTTIEKNITTIGGNGTQYLWIMYTAAGVVALAATLTYYLLRKKDKKVKLEVESNEE